MSMALTLPLPTIEAVLGEEFGSWFDKAKSLPRSFAWLLELEDALKVLWEKCGENSIKPYANRLLAATEQAVSRKNENEFESLLFEVLCLGRLAVVADEILLLETIAPKGQPVPEAKLYLAGRECVVECRAPFPNVSKDEVCESKSLEAILAWLRRAIGADDLPKKFAAFKWRVNLVFVSYLVTQPDVGTSLVPLLYGREFLTPSPFNPFERDSFVVPFAEELSDDALFAHPDWQVISGVAWVSYQPTPLDNPQTIRWEGFVFPNPKALRSVPLEVAVKLHEALNLKTFPRNSAERREMAEWLAPKLVQHLKEKRNARLVKFWGSFKDTIFWHRRSDIDIVVDGLDWKQLAEAELELIAISPFVIPIQLTDWESLPEKWRKKIEGGDGLMTDWRDEVKHELEQVKTAVEIAQQEMAKGDPAKDLTIRVTIAKALHDFYNGVERILQHLLTVSGKESPSGGDWHKKLLEQVAGAGIISPNLQDILDDYREFRHVFRSIYVFQLDWERMKALARDLPNVYKQTRREIESFLARFTDEANLSSSEQ